MAELEEFSGVHAQGPVEFTVCGLAPEAFESGDADEPIVIAGTGELVTCPTCRRFIDFAKSNFKRYRYTP